MLPILLALTLQAQAPASPPPDLPVSLDRVRDGLARPGRFDAPPSLPFRAWRRPLFRVRIQEMQLEGNAWDDRSVTPPWVRHAGPQAHADFLASVTPEEVRSSTVSPCCNVLPVVSAVANVVRTGIRGMKERRAKREVERAMDAAGIRR